MKSEEKTCVVKFQWRGRLKGYSHQLGILRAYSPRKFLKVAVTRLGADQGFGKGVHQDSRLGSTYSPPETRAISYVSGLNLM